MKSQFVLVFFLILSPAFSQAKTVVRCDPNVKKSTHKVSTERNGVVLVEGLQIGSLPYYWTSDQDLPFRLKNPTGPDSIGAYSVKSFRIEVIEQVKQTTKYTFRYSRPFDPATKAPLATCTVQVRRN
jgi:hypothetical protein